ncbi:MULTISPECIES: sugar ABC transporter substrate-binding protein [Micromonospora]|uniref:Monosaccharide ABC transporter substrate-binding protein, CUT2 family n=1 Tax=Micromonospora yangpuensis TaxID=683228 RepID=A0A1C6V9T6_9ACTN|nr:substrate-binding domain-containing protein [Micromonospora yangpuensis]GGM22474.1 sugar ABC transporter substrate-binding protein [Micromonospora yangpuensis]SCL63113.1 monosaccharide ABC transporter substrate-binding protein, CUT2 family [Micromonospora yangpuensis]
MRRGILTIAAVGLLATGGLTACGDDSGDTEAGGNEKKPKIGVILPDSKSSARWETADRKFLQAAFEAAGVDYDIQNAQNDKNAFQTIADQMITQGATALMIVNLDSGTGKAVLDKAKAQGVATIDYDRLTLGGSAQYYVSFDNEAVGKLQGEGLSKCLADQGTKNPVIAYLNGSPTDNNATLFKNGYDSVLKPKFDSKEFVKGPEQSVPDWDPAQATTLFEQMLTQTSGKIDGVLSANDGLGNAAISVLKKNKLNGKVPVTGQDADLQGLQNILAGDQCMTVYKAVKQEADAAAELAIAVAKGERKETGQTVKDPESGRDVPARLLEPKLIYKENVKDVVADGYVEKDKLCADSYAKLCADAGIS